MKRKAVIWMTLLSLALFSVNTTFAAEGKYSYDDWAAQEIEEAVGLGIVPVELQRNYKNPISRGEFTCLTLTYMAAQYHYPTMSESWSVYQPSAETRTDIEEFVNDYCLSRLDRNGVLFDEGEFDPNTGITYLGAPRFWDGFFLMRTKYPFSDVSEEHYYARYINIAYAFGLVNGRGERVFAPDDSITRQEAAALFRNVYASYAEPLETAENATYIDGKEISSWAEKAVRWVCDLKIMQGDEAGRFLPKNFITRQEAILCFLRLYKNAPVSRLKGNREPLITLHEKVNSLLINDTRERYLFFEKNRVEGENFIVVFGNHGGRHKTSTDNSLYVLYDDGGIWDLLADLPKDRWWSAPYEIEDLTLDETDHILNFHLLCECDLYPENVTKMENSSPIWKAGSYLCRVDLFEDYPKIKIIEN